jgi:E3 ubiquitin-protein ligase BRE1
LIDEMKLLLGSAPDKGKGEQCLVQASRDSVLTNMTERIFQSSLQFDDAESFEKHLKARSEDIREIVSQLQAHSANGPPEVSEVQSQLAKKLAEEKVTISELEKTLSEKQQLEESLEAASLRYMVAERKLDRARSLTVAKLEKQFLMGAQRTGAEATPTKREESSPVNGGTPVADRNPELEEANNRLTAVTEKQKEQLQKLETENASLLSQITDVKVKVSSFTLKSGPRLNSVIAEHEAHGR